MKREPITVRNFCLLSGISGIVGVSMIIISFMINAGPPQGATDAQLAVFGHRNYSSILWGAWLPAVGPVFIVLFAFAVVKLAGATRWLLGWMTFFGASILMTVSLIEITFYIAVLFKQPPIIGPIIMDLINAVQHLYFIVAAPALFIPLGIIIIYSYVLPKVFGYLAIIIALLFAIIGVTSLLSLVIPPKITILGSLQGLWWLSASVALVVRAGKVHFDSNEQ